MGCLCSFKKAREDKQGNIPDPKVAEKEKLIDDLKKQVSEGTLTVSGCNDVLTLAWEPLSMVGESEVLELGFPQLNSSICRDSRE
ncbi:hypothetical protein L3X38_004425 [Prunus dulcis]|uniref:Uncharacterized protein n=1 Tax=Prunus dulcis TaxID=3755 RepID=A0AAD4ZNY8_PRUDU|nr:hypothetical protein L3X38_004425 [Prunus dulcis]